MRGFGPDSSERSLSLRTDGDAPALGIALERRKSSCFSRRPTAVCVCVCVCVCVFLQVCFRCGSVCVRVCVCLLGSVVHNTCACVCLCVRLRVCLLCVCVCVCVCV